MSIPGLNWYVVKLVYQIVREESNTSEFDVQYRMIRADERNWALEKAHTLGRLGESIFLNNHDQQVHWKFLGVVDIHPIEWMDDAALLYSETKETKNENEFKQIVNIRSKQLQSGLSFMSVN